MFDVCADNELNTRMNISVESDEKSTNRKIVIKTRMIYVMAIYV